MAEAIGIRPQEVWVARDLVCVLSSEEAVLKYTPDSEKVKELPGLLLHTTARGKTAIVSPEAMHQSGMYQKIRFVVPVIAMSFRCGLMSLEKIF